MSIPENHFDKNLQFLLSNHRLIAHNTSDLEKIKNPPQDWFSRLDTIATSGFQVNGIWLHSQRDPKREARRQLEFAADEKLRHLIIISAGIGYPFVEALTIPGIESILLLETNPEFLFYVLALFPFYQTLKDITVYYCENPQIDTLEEILPFFQNKNVNKIGFYKHRAAFQLFPQVYSLLEFQVSEILYKRSINQATIVKFQGIWNKNIALNVKELRKGRSLTWLMDQLREKIKNIVICGAGPSLSASYNELKLYREKYLLIAADTAFVPLASHGIFPDIVISADPQWVNHYFALHQDARKSIWALDPVLCYASSHYLNKHDVSMVWWDNPFYLDWIIREGESRGEIAHGGSVSTNAFDLATRLIPESIILVGQDLSFSQNLAHVKGSALESMIYNKNNRFGGFEMHNYNQLTAIPPRVVNSTIHNEKGIFTNDKLRVFTNWFESQSAKVLNQSKIRLYNATAHGVMLRNFEHVTLTKILEDKLPEIDLQENLKNTILDSVRKNHPFLDRLVSLQKDCLKIQTLYYNNFDLAKKMMTGSHNKSAHIHTQLNENDEKIKHYKDLNQILAINAQHIILKITEFEEHKGDTEVLFYKFMYISAKKLNYLLNKMVHILRSGEHS